MSAKDEPLIKTTEDLAAALRIAAELEHGLCCQYLFAGFTLRRTLDDFADLPGELQNVLRAQLRQAGDVSAVIETPGGFLLCVAKEKTAAALSVAMLSLPKRSYEAWLDQWK